ncbi:MAG TPA: hypothetical protein VEC12_09770 [Bacteroidia bacterium]|nr:hypothetical protein [Bacteroidia bacterium]
MSLWDSIVSIGKQAENVLVSVGEAVENRVVGISTTIGAGVTSFGIAVKDGIQSATGEVINWTLTSAEEINNFTLNTYGKVADFSAQAFDASVNELKNAWDWLSKYISYKLPILGAPDSSAVDVANKIFDGQANLLGNAAATSKMTYIFLFTVADKKVGFYASRAGKWGFIGNGLDGIGPSAFIGARVELFMLFDDSPGGKEYLRVGAYQNGQVMMGANILLTTGFNFLGFQVACETPNYLLKVVTTPIAAPSNDSVSMYIPINPGNSTATAAGFDYLTLMGAVPSLQAAGDVASSAKQTGNQISTDAVEKKKATALGAREVASSMFLKYTPDWWPGDVSPPIAYLDCFRSVCVAQISGQRFLIGGNGDFSNPVKDRSISIINHSGIPATVTLNINGNLVLTENQSYAHFTYTGHDNTLMTARMYAPYMLHAPNGNFSSAHAGVFINYLSHDGTPFWARLDENGTFCHAPGGDFKQPIYSDEIWYTAWGGKAYHARIERDALNNLIFRHAPDGNWQQSFLSQELWYICPDSTQWKMMIMSPVLPASETTETEPYFVHAPNGNVNSSKTDKILCYQTPDGAKWAARFNGTGFTHAPNGDFSNSHDSSLINYKRTEGSSGWARIEKDSRSGRLLFRISAEPTFPGEATYVTSIEYMEWNNTPWSAFPYFPGLSVA